MALIAANLRTAASACLLTRMHVRCTGGQHEGRKSTLRRRRVKLTALSLRLAVELLEPMDKVARACSAVPAQDEVAGDARKRRMKLSERTPLADKARNKKYFVWAPHAREPTRTGLKPVSGRSPLRRSRRYMRIIGISIPFIHDCTEYLLPRETGYKPRRRTRAYICVTCINLPQNRERKCALPAGPSPWPALTT